MAVGAVDVGHEGVTAAQAGAAVAQIAAVIAAVAAGADGRGIVRRAVRRTEVRVPVVANTVAQAPVGAHDVGMHHVIAVRGKERSL